MEAQRNEITKKYSEGVEPYKKEITQLREQVNTLQQSLFDAKKGGCPIKLTQDAYSIIVYQII